MAQEKEKISKKPEEKPKMMMKRIIRIASTDIPADTTLYHGLTKIKGISWSFSNALCTSLGMDKSRKISSLSEADINSIMEFIKNPKVSSFLLNRRADLETGENKHLITSDLDLQRDFDIKKMKKIRSYKGWRHAMGQPVRGQRTRSHFRKGRSIGVQKTKVKPTATKKTEK